jgi:hypothetical protein
MIGSIHCSWELKVIYFSFQINFIQTKSPCRNTRTSGHCDPATVGEAIPPRRCIIDCRGRAAFAMTVG